jgi:hypothetical protein
MAANFVGVTRSSGSQRISSLAIGDSRVRNVELESWLVSKIDPPAEQASSTLYVLQYLSLRGAEVQILPTMNFKNAKQNLLGTPQAW